jgi:hypothetical protein
MKTLVRIGVVMAGIFLGILLAAQAPGPKLTETEQLKFQNFSLRNALLQQQQQALQKEFQDFQAAVEKAHPGYLLTANGDLQAIPKKPVEEKKP